MCQFHFKEECVLPSRRLTKTAVPINYRELQHTPTSSPSSSPLTVLTPTRKYEARYFPESSPKIRKTLKIEKLIAESLPSTSQENLLLDTITDFPSSPTFKHVKISGRESPKSKKIRKLSMHLQRQSRIIANKRAQISKLKAKKNYSVLEAFKAGSYPSTQSKTIAMMQQRTKKRPWSKDERELAISLFYTSPAAYRSMRRQKIILPSVTTVKEWIGSSKYSPGFNKDLFRQIRLKARTMDRKDKVVALSFDEMAIKEKFEYSKALDIIEGFEDLGYLGRSNKPAKKAMVLMAWREGYFPNGNCRLVIFLLKRLSVKIIWNLSLKKQL